MLSNTMSTNTFASLVLYLLIPCAESLRACHSNKGVVSFPLTTILIVTLSREHENQRAPEASGVFVARVYGADRPASS